MIVPTATWNLLLAGVGAMEFDGNGNKTADVDQLGRRTTYLYDADDRQTRITYPDLTTKQFTYDFRKKVLTEADQLGRVTRFTYDRAGQLTSTTYAAGTADEATASTAYDAAGRKISETSARGGVTLYAYDTADRMVSMTDPVGNVTQYGYDAAGRRTSMTDAKNRVTSYTYDARGRQLTEIYADGRTTSKTYDGMGSVLTQTDEDGKVTAFGYDVASQLTRVTNALGQVTQYGYDAAGNKISQTDARNSITTYQWDALNRRTRRTLPLGQFETYGYDAVGNQTSRTDFNGKTTAFLYDSLNRQLRRTPDASFGAPPVQYTYAATGKRLSMNDVTGATTYSYDNRDRLLVKATPQGSLTYTHDRNSMVASVLSSNTGGVSVSYAYDLADRLTTVTDNFAGGGATSYTYEATNVPQRVAYPNGMRHMFGYDQRDRQTSVSIENGASVLASWAYTYGPAGHRLTSVENNGRNVSYAYDAAYKLTNETIAGDPLSVNGLLFYTHDPVGNRLSLASTLAPLGAQSKAYDANDRLTDETYDANGSTLSANGWTYGYEFEDRLVSATKAAVSVAMQYDGDGNRVVRTEGSSTLRYLVDNLTPTGYVQVAEEVVAGSVARVYVHGPQRVSQRQLVSGAWVFSYYGYDESVGSVRLLSDATGSVTDRYSYDGFGNVVGRTGSTANANLYRGEQFESSLGMYYLRARWYRPESGRFSTMDDFQGEASSPLSLHSFSYVHGCPTYYSDPSGHGAINNLAITFFVRVVLPICQSALAVKILLFVNQLLKVPNFPVPEPIPTAVDWLVTVCTGSLPLPRPITPTLPRPGPPMAPGVPMPGPNPIAPPQGPFPIPVSPIPFTPQPVFPGMPGPRPPGFPRPGPVPMPVSPVPGDPSPTIPSSPNPILPVPPVVLP